MRTFRAAARRHRRRPGGGVGTAQGLAGTYGEFANGGSRLGLGEDTLCELMAPPVPPARGFRDACLTVEVHFSLGFMKPGPANPFGHPGAFGSPGTGGSFGFADPETRIGFAYIPNRMQFRLEDPRDPALRTAMRESIGETDPSTA